MFFDSEPRDHNAVLWALCKDIVSARQLMLSDIRFEYLGALFDRRPNPESSRFAYALGALEDQLVDKLRDMICASCPTVRALVWMFDGFVLHANAEAEQVITAALLAFTAETGVHVTTSRLQSLTSSV